MLRRRYGKKAHPASCRPIVFMNMSDFLPLSEAGSRNLRAALFERSPTALFWADRQGTLLEINEALLKLLRIPDRAQILGRCMSEFAIDADECRSAFERISGQPFV